MTEKNDPLAYTQPTPTELGAKLDEILERMTKVEHLSVAELLPGDVFVYSVPGRMRHEDFVHVEKSFKAVFPGQRLIVIDQGATLGILTQPQTVEDDRPEVIIDLDRTSTARPRDPNQPL